MFSRDALSGGLNYWIDQINGGFFTVPASAAYIADAASGEDMAVLDAKQVAASKLTCAIGDDASKLSAFQANLASARASIAEITTAEEAEAYDKKQFTPGAGFRPGIDKEFDYFGPAQFADGGLAALH